VQIVNINSRPDWTGQDVIVGGGGMFIFPLQEIRRARKVIAWGIGTNESNRMFSDYSVVKDYDLVGLRDWGTPHEWVPCASCMSPLFDKYRDAKIEHPVVFFAHQWFKFDLPYPKLSNDCETMEEAIKFMSSAETVITTSYHGAYWATLLGKKVMVLNPFTSKFFYMKHPPLNTSLFGHEKCFDKLKSYPEALSECREANIKFEEKAWNILSA
jgi:hypothetical protein